MALVLGMRHGERVRLTLPDGREAWLQLLYGPHTHPHLKIEAPLDVIIEREKIIARPAAVDREEAPGMGS